MKRIRDDGYVYVPTYNDFDDRTKSEKVLDSTAPIMFILFILLGCWIGGAILLLMVPSTMPLLYWPLQLIRFVGKWGTIIGWPIWLIVYIVGLVTRRKEHRKERRRLDGEQ